MPQFITHYLGCSLFTCFSLIFILSYNHKEGPKTKYLFYIFYPTHLIALYLLHSLL
ncbi:MAG: TraX family protein [Clostridia bacterium]